MRLYLDCEYNGFGGELLSIALVAGYRNPFYRIVEDTTETPTEWVMANVLPVISAYPGYHSRGTRDEIRRDLRTFLRKYHTVHVVTNWPEDIIHFCRLLLTDVPGERIDTPPLTMSILGINSVSEMPHNALADALGMMRAMRHIPLADDGPATPEVSDAPAV